MSKTTSSGQQSPGDTQRPDLGAQRPPMEKQWTPPKHERRLRSRSLWAAAAAMLLAVVAYLALGSRGTEQPQEPVVEGPSPIVSATGPVVPEKRTRLSFTLSGRVKNLTVRPGDKVTQGQLLAQLEPSSLQSSSYPGSAPFSPGASDLYLTAPFDGTAGSVPVNEWETVAPGTPVVVLGDLSTLRVEIDDLSEADVGRLQVGQPAEISFEAFDDRKVAGRVARVSPMNNSKGGGVNYDVVVDFADSDLPNILWGMTAHVDIHVQ